MHFITLFPEAENVHLIKDVGMIPFSMKKRFGIESTVACYKNGDYPYANAELNGVNVVFLKRIFGNGFFDALIFLLFNSGKYDVLHTFHFRFRTLVWLTVFKVLHPKGKSYLKLDANEMILNKEFVGIKGRLQRYLMKKIDLISVETSYLSTRLSKKWGREVKLIPNGYLKSNTNLIEFKDKQNTIITVGRIGAPEKRTDILLEAFAIFSRRYSHWTLELVGPIEEDFKEYIQQYFECYPELKEKILFSGNILDRKILFDRYASAKIFCLTSEWESFGISMIEAASNGCYIICSAVISAADITCNEKYGRIFPINDTNALASILAETALDEALMERNCMLIQEFAMHTFSWSKIVESINESLKIQAY